MKKLVLALALVVCVVLVLPGVASASTPTLKKLARTVVALQKKVKAQAATIASQGTKITTLTSRISADEATIASQGTTVSAHATTLANAASLLAIAPYVSLNTNAMDGVAGPNIIFQGANVHVMSSTSQGDSTGLGNLIVGWDNPTGGIVRTGSNNLVVGRYNGFTSNGCLIAGEENSAGGMDSSITGGYSNVTTGDFASVCGGQQNQAGYLATVGGGILNHATGWFSTVSGGEVNTASGTYSSVSGGYGIISSATDGWGHP